MKTVSWVHITDLHYGAKSQDWLWPTLRERFYEDLKKTIHRSGPWDIVFFSGDLTQSGGKAEFQGLTNLLTDMWEAFDKLGARPILLAVPGNHDLCRPDPELASVIVLKRWHEEPTMQAAFWRERDSEYRILVRQCFDNYSAWWSDLKRVGIPTPSEIAFGIVPGDFSTVLQINDLRIGTIGLNSAFLQLGAENYDGKLVVHPLQLNAVTENDPPRWCEQNSINFLMTHHPPAWLHNSAVEHFRSEISPPGRFLVQICGHLHEPSSEVTQLSGSLPLRRLQGPSLFGLRSLGDHSTERIHGYSVGSVKLDQSFCSLSFWPRQMVRKHAGHYDMVPDLRYDLDPSDAVVETSVDPTFSSNQALSKAKPRDSLAPSPVADPSRQFSDEDAKEFLRQVPMFRLPLAAEHGAVRLYEQQAIRDALREDRAAWLSVDWGLEKEGFLGAALSGDGCEAVYRIDFEGCSNREDLFDYTREQLGITLQ